MKNPFNGALLLVIVVMLVIAVAIAGLIIVLSYRLMGV